MKVGNILCRWSLGTGLILPFIGIGISETTMFIVAVPAMLWLGYKLEAPPLMITISVLLWFSVGSVFGWILRPSIASNLGPIAFVMFFVFFGPPAWLLVYLGRCMQARFHRPS